MLSHLSIDHGDEHYFTTTTSNCSKSLFKFSLISDPLLLTLSHFTIFLCDLYDKEFNIP